MAAQSPENQQSFLQRMFGARPKPAPAPFPRPQKPPSGSFPPGSEEAYLAALPIATFGAPVDNYFSNFFEDLNDLAIQGRVVHSDKLNLGTILGRGKSRSDWLKEIDNADSASRQSIEDAYRVWEDNARYSVIKPALKDYFSPGRYISRTGKSLVYQHIWNTYLADRFLKGAVEKGYGIAEEVKYGDVEGIKVEYLEPTYPPTAGSQSGVLSVGKDGKVYLYDASGHLISKDAQGNRVSVGKADNYGRIIDLKDPGGRVINIKYTPLKGHPELRNAGVWRDNLDRLVKPTGSSDPTLSAVMGISEKDRPFLERWFSPKTFRSGLFSGTGRLGEWRSFLDHPFTYSFGKFIFREYPLPGGKTGFGLRRRGFSPGPKTFFGESFRDVSKEIQKHGVFGGLTKALYQGKVKPPVVTAVKTVGARAGKAAGKAAGQVIGGGIRKIIATAVRQIITKGLAALGSIAGPIGTAIGYIAGFIVTRFFKWIVLIGCGCIFLFLGLVGFIIFIIITFFFGFAPIKGEAAELPPTPSVLAIEKKVSCAGSAFGSSCQIKKGATGLAAFVSYTITVTNNSEKEATSIVVTDTFSESLGVESSFLIASLGGGASNTKTYNLVSIPNTSSERIISNTASVAGVIDGQSEAGGESSAQVIIGNPPDTIPCGWPASGSISSLFGPDHPLGIDIAASTGDDAANGQAVYSSLSGTLTLVENRPSGVAVTINSAVAGKNYSITYVHLHANVYTNWKSKEGTRIFGGALIGFTKPGESVASSGTHLHYETRENGNLVDPMKFTGVVASGTNVSAGGCWWKT